ncbi:MAG: hypothetical protein A2233_05660 [Candidatus Kerfeldbacteria bacterium RIFOXYA2_FULL_38_24]|uniref:Methyltransferase type 11 domain-containing protein n=1 Tax=Candidatus Kerfeldbacteria bacterium RIFOXYB2_FULL_38_14 TaxID=1798547 RepID=A0A1G2BFS0_9BACT|nr:MAG: hypothetical protein A2233_05660 [Candidatus Kerfeldbacteria bacterium RIFOXYA2_FULL_38_24]OGY87047.1 MAG: hypothetical protein A2319_01860 [Candidatus Kerfeldbacteria bacterium RIFOXYB2_FULL_38_14]
MKRHRILEVGPGITPMHHRSKGERDLQLGEDEEYTGLDQPHAVDRMSEHEVWKKANEQYGDRAHLIQGDRADMSGIADESIDELVALGTHAREGKVVSEFRRVLAPGGLLRLGVPTNGLPELMSTWGVRLQRLGFTELSDQQQEYNYSSRPDIPEATISYIVVTFQKGGKAVE